MIIMPVQTYFLSDVMGFIYQQANLDITTFDLKQHLISFGRQAKLIKACSVDIDSNHKLVYNSMPPMTQSTASEVSDDD